MVFSLPYDCRTAGGFCCFAAVHPFFLEASIENVSYPHASCRIAHIHGNVYSCAMLRLSPSDYADKRLAHFDTVGCVLHAILSRY